MATAMALGANAKPADAIAVLDSPHRHVRAANASMGLLLRKGYEKSPTFAALLARLEHSDLYVYVEEVERLPGALEGRILILPRRHGVRYARIQIALRGTRNESIAVLGHELRHAVEVADASTVEDNTSLVALYRRIGIEYGNNEFDTVEAQETGRQVLRELSA
jgi:hypothetical protein